MGFSEFLGNAKIVTALRGALRNNRVPQALLFTGPRGVGKVTLARMFAQAANCESLTDDFCGECSTCLRIAELADPQRLIEQGLVERGESADAAMVERTPLILQTHPDVWLLVPDPVRLKTPVARPLLRVGQLRAVQRAAYFQPMGRRRVFIFDAAETMRYDVQNIALKLLEEPPGSATLILTAPSPFSLLPDLLELTSGAKSPLLRNPNFVTELQALARSVDSRWVMRAISGIDEIASGARRNLNRQLGLDSFATSLVPAASAAAPSRK